jgi:acylphosphatase
VSPGPPPPGSGDTTGPARVRRGVVIAGRVQGVGFRYSCRNRAVEAGLGGFVRNRADGRVEAAFEGRPASVEALIAWCRIGPPLASVTAVAVTEEEPVGETSFAVS